MADTMLTADIVAKAALPILENELGVLGTLYRDAESEFNKSVNGYKVGATVNIRRPADFTVRSGAVRSDQDVIEGQVPLTVDQQKGVDFNFTSTDMTLSVESLAERVIKPAMCNLVHEVARDVFATAYTGIYNWAGTPGQTVNSYSDFSKAPERLDEMSVPMDSRHAVMGPSDYHALVANNTGLFVSDVAKQALRQARLGMLGGLDTWMSQVTPSHTIGDHGGTPLVDGATQNVTYDTAKNTWTQTLITDGWDTSVVLKAGDVFTIAGVNMVNPKTKQDTGIAQQFVVTADVTTNASALLDTNLVISPPIIASGPHQTVTAAPADDAAITYLGTANATVKQGLAYHRSAIALAVAPMELPAGAVNPARRTRNGLSVRVIPTYDGTNDVSAWRLDILYGRKLIDPRLATRFSGTA